MPDSTPAKGACLCGAVSITADTMDTKVGACHCKMCRQWGGGPLMAVDCGTSVSFSGDENIAVFSSSKWAERGFCKQCGSHLFYRLKGSGQYIMPVGLFGDDERMVFDHQVFVDERPAYYCFANETRDMTGPEVFAMYGTPSD